MFSAIIAIAGQLVCRLARLRFGRLAAMVTWLSLAAATLGQQRVVVALMVGLVWVGYFFGAWTGGNLAWSPALWGGSIVVGVLGAIGVDTASGSRSHTTVADQSGKDNTAALGTPQ